MVVISAGCQQPGRIAPRLQELSRTVDELERQLLLLRQENQALRDRLEAAATTKAGAGQQDPLQLHGVRITGYTGLYDKDRDGQAEQFIVYVQPLDSRQDAIKAPGTVEIQLWDLSCEPNQALLARWTVGPEQLYKTWSATFLTINYRLVFDRPKGLPDDRPVTVKVLFTDSLTGRVFTDQRVVQPR